MKRNIKIKNFSNKFPNQAGLPVKKDKKTENLRKALNRWQELEHAEHENYRH